MTERQVSRIIKISDRERARTKEKIRRYEAQCRTIDSIMDNANEWIRNG